MSDFAQPGAICTLPRLREAHGAALEAELAEHAAQRPIALILPCHAADLTQPALRRLCAELRGAPWLAEIVVSLNGFASGAAAEARARFGGLPQRVRLLWNDAPAARAVLTRLLGPVTQGKGLNVWAALGLLAHEERVALVATQDCDVASFRRGDLARLCAPCVHPRLGFRCAKMYYARVTDRLYGRVSRLFFAPLLQAVRQVAGPGPLVEFLLAFRYPLAGETALALPLARALPFAPGWGLEAATLCEVFRRAEPGEVCQVEGSPGYDHRHQPALEPMCGEIARTLLAQLAQEGCAVEAHFRTALQAAFARASALALRRSEALALLNGLPFDHAAEAALVAAFAAQLAAAGPAAAPLPPWSQLEAGPLVALAEELPV